MVGGSNLLDQSEVASITAMILQFLYMFLIYTHCFIVLSMTCSLLACQLSWQSVAPVSHRVRVPYKLELQNKKKKTWATGLGIVVLDESLQNLMTLKSSSITSVKWILVCYQMTITAQTTLFAFLNFLFLIFYKIMGTFVHAVYSSPEFLFAYTVHSFS